MRALAEWFPVIAAPRWMRRPVQAIGARDLAAHLLATLDRPAGENAEHEVAGAGAVTCDPKGLSGIAYWYALYPIHSLVFGRMLKGIARAAESGEGDGRRPA